MLPMCEIACPYCGETIMVSVDASAGAQVYIEDCQVCCRPIRMVLEVGSDGDAALSAYAENDA